MEYVQGQPEMRTHICEKENRENKSMLIQFETLAHALRMNAEVAEGIGNILPLESGKGEFPNSRWSAKRLTAEYGSRSSCKEARGGEPSSLV